MKKILILIGIVVIIICAIKIKTDTVKVEGLTIEKLDKISAYKIVYKNDYKFDEFLKTGSRDDNELYKYLENNGFHPHKRIMNNSDLFGCTCFTVKNAKDEVLFGRNFDWYSHPCTLVYTSPAGAYSSVSMVDLYYTGVNKYLFWNGAVTNEHLLSVPYIPLDGVNECGVAIGVMSVPKAESSSDFSKKTISSLGAVRLVLDYAANVDEAISLMSNYNIYFQKIPIHYMISDSSGKSVIVEYVEGKMNILENKELWQVSTNFVLSGYDNIGRGQDRYKLAEQNLKDTYLSITKSNAMDILNNVSQGSYTIWSIVYDLKKKDFDLCISGNYSKVYHSCLN